jgi:hypothetical protein
VVRLPFALFRPEQERQPPLDPARIQRISMRYELRRGTTTAPQQEGAVGAAAAMAAGGRGRGRRALGVCFVGADREG